MLRQFGILLLISCMGFAAAAQDTLPSFTLVNKGSNRIIISWTNPYTDIRQLTIQRSFDSTKNFKSILTLPDPNVPQNGYADTKATNEHMFYRVYILLDSGKYVFSKSKKPVLDTSRTRERPREIKQPEIPAYEAPKTAPEKIVVVTEEPRIIDTVKTIVPDKKESVKPNVVKPKEIPERIIYIVRRDTLIGQIGERSVRRFRDSVAVRTKDTLSFNTADTIRIRPFVPKEMYRPSKFVFTERYGSVKIALPLAAEKKYNIRFFDEFNIAVFEIKQVKDSLLTLDKSNFVHAGWFTFELYEDGQLKEKNKLFIPKDF
ncbi:MAG: hypothetical protein ABIQ88_05670 [Chitinophagaceae bacterium]